MYKDYDEKIRRSDKENYREHLKKFVGIFRANSCNSVLDLGCGNGIFLDLLAESGMRGTGVEMDAQFATEIRGRNLQVIEGEALAVLREMRESYDGAFLSHLIEHFQPLQARGLLQEIFRVLNPGGTLLIVTPNARSLIQHLQIFYQDYTHQRFYPAELIKFFLEDVGFVEAQSEESEESAYLNPPKVQPLRERPERFSSKQIPNVKLHNQGNALSVLDKVSMQADNEPRRFGRLALKMRRWLGISDQAVGTLARNQEKLYAQFSADLEALRQGELDCARSLDDLIIKYINTQALTLRHAEVVDFLLRNALRPNDIYVSATKPAQS